MAKLFASWVPGYAAVAEAMGNPPLRRPEGWTLFSEVNGSRNGQGANFSLTPNAQNWFHIPIPTPVLVEDRRATLGRVMALFRIDNGALIRVLVFDGPNKILDRPGLDVAGDHSGGLDNSNTFDVNHDGITWGVGFSLLVSAGGAGAELYIASAGGDFFHNI